MVKLLSDDKKLQYLRILFDVFKETAAEIRNLGNDGDVEIKYEAKQDYTSVFTQADALADQMIYDGLSAATPDIPVISEENYEEEMTHHDIQDLTKATFWLVDPIDGSAHFKEGNGKAAMLGSLIHNGRPVVGLVYRIFEDAGYYAMKDMGAFKFKNKSARNREQIKVGKSSLNIGISIGYEGQFTSDHKAFSGFCDVEVKNYEQIQNLRKIYEQAEKERLKRGQAYRACGNYELGAKLQCLIAEGKLDFLPFLMDKCAAGEWDIAASDLILQEAGGYLTDLEGHIIIYGHPDQKVPNYAAYNNKDVFEHFKDNLFDAYDLNEEGVFVLKADPIPEGHAFAL